MNKKILKSNHSYNQFIKEHYTLVICIVCLMNLIILPINALFGFCYMLVAALNYSLIIHPCEVCNIPIPKWSQKIEDFDKLL